LSASDFFDQLEWGGMGSYRYEREHWSVQIDAIYATLAADAQSGQRAEAEQAMIEIGGGYRLNEFFEVVIGARGWDYQVELGAIAPGNAPARESDGWTDPFVGARFNVPLGEQWDLVMRADVGGFGVGSDFAWHATAVVGWHASDNVSLLAGYRIFDLDFESNDADGVRVDLQEHGPALGAAFKF
jgi:opacity protein-like surface antigen